MDAANFSKLLASHSLRPSSSFCCELSKLFIHNALEVMHF